MKEFLEAGRIINKRGLNGELKVESYCNTPEDFCKLQRLFLDADGGDCRKVIFAKTYKGFVYVKLEGIDSAEAADGLRNKSLYLERADVKLEDGKVFIDDMLGLDVLDTDTGVRYGTLKEVFNRGASDILRVTNGDKEYLFPSVPEFVKKIDVNKGIFIRPIPGMIDDAEEIR